MIRIESTRFEDVSNPEDEDAIHGRWMTVQWQVSPKHHMFVAVGRKYGGRITIAWGFGSSAVRRDPEFRAIAADWGFHNYGDRQLLVGEQFEFVSEGGLRIVASSRIALDELDSAAPLDAVSDGLRTFGAWAWVRLRARAPAPA